MRTNSPKQTEASRANGSRSKGPNSAHGKQRVRLNAVKDGLFSKELVIESAGEQQEDFDKLKAAVWDFFQPANLLEEMLVADFVENWWRRQRIRRLESAELKNRIETLAIRRLLQCSDEVEVLKVQFLTLVAKYPNQPSSEDQQDRAELPIELEEIRKQLASTSVGVEFLTDTMKKIEKEAASKGEISALSEVLIFACCGFANEFARDCRLGNLINKRESQAAAAADKSKQEQTKSERPLSEEPVNEEAFARILKEQERKSKKGKGKFRQILQMDPKSVNTEMLVQLIRMAAGPLVTRKKFLKYLENLEDKSRSTAAILPPETTSDRFSRAETAIERRMYRALGMLLAMQQPADTPKMLS